MKKQKNPIALPLNQLKNGALSGGFSVIHSRHQVIAGLAEPTNNCTGTCGSNNCNGANCGNCTLGCGRKDF